jgi:O-antigen/teichoic acid export membrane protein
MLGQLIWLVASAAAAPLLPQVAAAPGATAANSRAATRLSRLVTGVSVAGAIVILATAWAIVPLVYGPAFSASVEPLLILLPGIVALAPAKVLASYVAGVGRPALNLVVSLVSLAVTLVLDLLLIPTIGIAGAAIASTAAYLVGAVMTVAVFRRLTRVRARDILLPTVEDLRQLRGAIAAGATGRRAR